MANTIVHKFQKGNEVETINGKEAAKMEGCKKIKLKADEAIQYGVKQYIAKDDEKGFGFYQCKKGNRTYYYRKGKNGVFTLKRLKK